MKFGVGQPLRRREDVQLVRGSGRFLDDIRIENQVHAVFVRSLHAHARLTGIDISGAEAMPGVTGVITHEDAVAGTMPVRGSFKSRDGSELKQSPKELLPKDRVRFAGEAVAMVVAETAALAKDAAERVIVEYDPLPAAVTVDDAPGSAVLWDHAPGNLAFDWADGNEAGCAEAFASAAKTVAVEVVQNRVVPNPMEVRGALAVYDAAKDSFTLFTSTQGASSIRDRIAVSLLKIPPQKLRVVSYDVGGGFGLKATVIAEQALVLIAAKKFGRPVKWAGERMESFLADGHGRDVVMKGELALDKDARILAMRLSNRANLGAYMSHVGPYIPTLGLRVAGGVYRVPAMYANVKGYFTNTPCVTSYRGAGRPEAIYVTERLMDAAADAFGLDRLEIRRRNLIEKHQIPYKNWRGLSIDSGEFPRLLDETARRADWEGFDERRKQSLTRGKRRGRGVSFYFEASGGPPGPEPSKIRFKDDGTVEVTVATLTNGQGHDTTFAQIVHEKLGVPFDKIVLRQGDSDFGLSGGGTVGSRSVQTAGNAIVIAAGKIVEKGNAAASQVLQAGGAEVVFEIREGVGRFRVGGTAREISLSELAATLKRDPVPGFENGLDDEGAFDSPPTFPNGCHICEAEVDEETGTVEIVRYNIVDDVGTVINPLLVEGQIHGGLAQGIGQALMEQAVYDRESGQLLTASFSDYAMPRAADMPELELSFEEIPCKTNPLGSKGAGEAGTIGSLPAIIGAVSDAVGVAHIDMPATPEKIWRALRRAGV